MDIKELSAKRKEAYTSFYAAKKLSGFPIPTLWESNKLMATGRKHLYKNCPHLSKDHSGSYYDSFRYLWEICQECVKNTPAKDPILYLIASSNIERAFDVLFRELDGGYSYVPVEDRLALVREAIFCTTKHNSLGAEELTDIAALLRSELEAIKSTLVVKKSPEVQKGITLYCAAQIAFDCVSNEFDPRDAGLEVSKYCPPHVFYDGHRNWMNELKKENSLREAKSNAIYDMKVRAGREPYGYSYIPEVGTMDPSRFKGPREWAKAEWEVAVEKDAYHITGSWEEKLIKTLESFGEEGTQKEVTLVITNLQAADARKVKEVLSAFTLKDHSDKKLQIFIAPEVVAHWVYKAIPRRRGAGGKTRVQKLGSRTTLEELETAIGLYDPLGDGPMSNFDTTMKSAKIVLK